jgi:hypothetical protein
MAWHACGWQRRLWHFATHSGRIADGAGALAAATTGPMLAVYARKHPTGVMTMITLLLIVLLIAALGSAPTWPHSRGWGYYPSSGIGLIFLVLLFLMLTHRV